jgi:hypothetical protein
MEKYLMEAANGMMVWVKAEDLKAWQKGQEEIKAGKQPNQKLVDALRERMEAE